MINGMPIEEFFKKLAEDVNVSTNENGSTYISIKTVKNRVNELLLPCNYNWVCPRIKVVKEADRISFVTEDALLELLDDEGKIICRRGIQGSVDLSFLKNSPTMSSMELSSLSSSAESKAFVDNWRSMGLAKNIQLSYKSGGGSKSEDFYEVSFTTGFTYSAKSKFLKANASINGKPVIFKVFADGIDKIAAQRNCSSQAIISCFTDNFGPGKRDTLVCKGSISSYKGEEQFVCTGVRE